MFYLKWLEFPWTVCVSVDIVVEGFEYLSNAANNYYCSRSDSTFGTQIIAIRSEKVYCLELGIIFSFLLKLW